MGYGLWLVAFGLWFMTALGRFLDPFLEGFRAQVGAKLAQVGTKLAQVGPKLAKSQHNLNKMGLRFSLGPPSWSHLGAQVGPSGAYVGPC